MIRTRPLKRYCVSTGEYGVNVSSERYRTAGTRLIRTSDVTEDGVLRPEDDAVFIDEDDAEGLFLAPSDLLFSRSGTLGRALLYPGATTAATFAGYLVRFRAGEDVEPRFLYYVSRSSSFLQQIEADAIQSTIGNFNAEKYGNLRVPEISLREQREIADFLDVETMRIDALIEKKRRMIDLLEVRWASSVRNRLTELAPVMPLKRRWRVIDCKHRTPAYVDEGYPVTSPGDISSGRIDLSACHRFVDEADFADLTEGRRPKRGDIIYSRNASAGVAAYVDTDEAFCMGQDVCLITSNEQDQRFLMYALNSIGADQLEPIKVGSTITRINVDQIGELKVAVPAVEIQRQVADALDLERERIDQVAQRVRQQIDLLGERRLALITAAVTGQLDLAKAAA